MRECEYCKHDEHAGQCGWTGTQTNDDRSVDDLVCECDTDEPTSAITPAERRVVDAAMRTMRLHAKSPVLVRVRGGRPCECDLCVECRALEAERKDKEPDDA